MDGDGVSIDIGDHEIWEQRRARLKALDSADGTHLQAESKYRVYLLLRDATKEGDIDKFIEALERCSAEEMVSLSDMIHVQSQTGNSLLHIAAGNEKVDILQTLLENICIKRLAAKKNSLGDTALHVAARAGRIHSAELLLGCCSSSMIKMANDRGNTALHEAVKNGHYDLTRLLLSRGFRPDHPSNKDSKCPLYLAVETGDLNILELLIEAMGEDEVPPSMKQGRSPVHGALMDRRIDMLEVMSKKKNELFRLTHGGFGTPLHLAAFTNYVDGVKFLADEFASSAFAGDKEGYLPIHVACKMGHLETIKEMLRHWPEPEELLSSHEGQNILHVAAKYGRASVVKYILGDPKLEKLINAKDRHGNTPLHLATSQGQPEVLLSLTRDNRVDLKLVNNSDSTAFDIVNEQPKKMDARLQQSLTRMILVSAGAPRSKEKAIFQPKGFAPGTYLGPPYMDRPRQTANSQMVVAMLIATIAFAAGFFVPGGYNDSKPDVGIATMLAKPMFDVFMICNTVAMYSSIIAVVILLWTQISDSNAVHFALGRARLLLLIALATISVAFMAGFCATVSKPLWIAVVALIVGITALIIILALCIALFVPLGDSRHQVQLFADYIIKAGILISRSVTGGSTIRIQPPRFQIYGSFPGFIPAMPMIQPRGHMEAEDSEVTDDFEVTDDSEVTDD